LAPFAFSDFAQLCFLKILIYARVLHRPLCSRNPKWPCAPKPPRRAEASRNSHPASRRVVVERLSSRMPSRRRAMDQRADRRNLRFRVRAADRRERRLRRARLVAAFSRPGGAEIFLPAKHWKLTKRGNFRPRVFARSEKMDSSQTDKLGSAASYHLSPRARKLSWLQSIENSRNEKIIALEVTK
jgi:hypothetical protein